MSFHDYHIMNYAKLIICLNKSKKNPDDEISTHHRDSDLIFLMFIADPQHTCEVARCLDQAATI